MQYRNILRGVGGAEEDRGGVVLGLGHGRRVHLGLCHHLLPGVDSQVSSSDGGGQEGIQDSFC